jgi:hypothetical protein
MTEFGDMKWPRVSLTGTKTLRTVPALYLGQAAAAIRPYSKAVAPVWSSRSVDKVSTWSGSVCRLDDIRKIDLPYPRVNRSE